MKGSAGWLGFGFREGHTPIQVCDIILSKTEQGTVSISLIKPDIFVPFFSFIYQRKKLFNDILELLGTVKETNGRVQGTPNQTFPNYEALVTTD